MTTPGYFGKYQLIDQVAVGGMAEIYKAVAIGQDGKRYLLAIKRILPQYSNDEEFVSMLVDEAKVMVLLNHPNIVPIIEFGKIEESYYIAMEFVHGVTLKELFKRAVADKQPLSIDLAVHLAREIGTGLAYAHRKVDENGVPLQIVHRDISPANILISFEGDVRITDFGIAKAANQSHRTQIGIIRGKTGYMSPEQTRANVPIDQRSDIFSLGVILFELLTGTRLFQADSVPEALKMIRENKVPPLQTLREEVPTELNEIVQKTLSTNPDERYQRADFFVDALNEFLTKWSPKGRIIRVSHSNLTGFLRRFFAAEMSHPPMEEVSGEFHDAKTEVGTPTVTKTRPQTLAANPLYELSEPEHSGGTNSTIRSANTTDKTGLDGIWKNSGTGKVFFPPENRFAAFFQRIPPMAYAGVVAVGVVAWGLGHFAKLPVPKIVSSEKSPTPTVLPSPAEELSTMVVQIRSSPPGARVIFEGRELPGQTPLDLPPIEFKKVYQIKILLNGYELYEDKIERKRGDSDLLTYGLVRSGPQKKTPPRVEPLSRLGSGEVVARLNLFSNFDCEVFVDKKRIPTKTPVSGPDAIGLTRGVHRILLVPDPSSGLRSYSFPLEIKRPGDVSCTYFFGVGKGPVCKFK